MDDTLFDHALTSRAALAALQRAWPLLDRRSLGDVWQEYSRLLESVYPAVLAGSVTADEARTLRFQMLARYCGRSISAAEGAKRSRMYREGYQRLRRAVPGAQALLERLHGRTVIGVVSNNETREQQEKLAYLGLDRFIDVLVVSEEVGTAKPDPRIFEVALERASVAADESVMIGDSWRNDIVGARNAGIGAVWFNRFRAEAPDGARVPEVHSFRAPRRVEDVLFREAARSRTG